MPLTPERWQQVARMYELVVDRDRASRNAVLSKACAGDEALRQEVESLLGQDAVQVVVDRPVWAAAARLLDGPDLRAAALGPYHIEGPLGSGGMGEVFHAIDSRLNRRVAIKVLRHGAGVDPQMRARFAREAQAVAALTHPHICTLYDIGRHEEVDFLVMEYLEGQTLASRLEGGPLAPDEALTRAIEVASALDHAHRHRIIHLDLKPGNIMLTASGAKLLDFGLARFRPVGDHLIVDADETRAAMRAAAKDPARIEHDDPQITNRGAVLGTVRYMSPEQIEAREVDVRSDLFAFGAVFFEMLTGTRAFDRDDAMSVRTAILEQTPPRVSSLQPSVPALVDDIVQRCLAKEPDKRWQTTGDVLRELKRASEAIAPARVRRTTWRRVAGMLGAATAGLLAWVWMVVHRTRTTTAGGQIRSIAVLPLQNPSGAPEQELVAELAKLAGRPVDADMHLQVMLGRHHLAKATEEALRKSVQHFEAAIVNDPENALAYAGLAEAYSGLNGFYVDPLEAMPKAKRAAQTALRLDDSLADAHAALGYVHLVYDWDGPSAERELLRALDLNPSLAIVRLKYAAYLTSQARHDHAAQEIRRALDLDPKSIQAHAFGTLFMLFTRRYDEAIELARQGLEFEPDSAFTLTFQGFGFAQQGRFKEAVDNLRQAEQLDNSATIRAVHAHVLAVAGEKAEAQRLVQQIENESQKRYFCPYEIGTVYVSLGDQDKAHDWFRKGIRGRADCMAWLGIEPWLDPFRSDPRYPGLLKDIGLDPTRAAIQ